MSTKLTIDELANFCKRKGFVYPSAEIYGGLSGFWDFGPLGVELKNNIKRNWWQFFVHEREDMTGQDGSIITHPKVWEASGHVESFVDFAIYDKKKKEKFKVDKHEVKNYENNPNFEILGEFNPMFTTQVGPVVKDSLKSYLRPETAQLIFANFKSIQENSRMRLPFGIAQIGKAFRNEISPREFIFRDRELEQMEIEYFIAPGMKCPYMDEIKDVETHVYTAEMQKKNESPKKMKLSEAHKKGLIKTDWHAYWMAQELSWFLNLGANPEKFRVRQHSSEEKSHYAVDTWDLEYEFPMGFRELQGFANRGDFDLKQHEKHSKKSMEINDPVIGKVLPHVVCEPSQGVERAFIVFLLDAYSINEKGNTILKLHPKLAPVKAAILPLVKANEKLVELSREIYKDLKKEFYCIYDDSGSIGRRYARNDETGTPFCLTIDEDSLKKKDVTIRYRDDGRQERIKISELKEKLRELINK